jgi:hypothetical protein
MNAFLHDATFGLVTQATADLTNLSTLRFAVVGHSGGSIVENNGYRGNRCDMRMGWGTSVGCL